MTRTVLSLALLALVSAGCGVAAPGTAARPFQVQFLNLGSFGTQIGSQSNIAPKTQTALTGQHLTGLTSAWFPIGSVVGGGPQTALSQTNQGIFDVVQQLQQQGQVIF